MTAIGKLIGSCFLIFYASTTVKDVAGVLTIIPVANAVRIVPILAYTFILALVNIIGSVPFCVGALTTVY